MENKSGNISDSSFDISDSEINEYKDKPYEELKQGKYRVKNRDGSLRCPFCQGKKKQQWQYRDLLQHASGVGSVRLGESQNLRPNTLLCSCI
ncbi:hypothetical protein RHMOL_Rhmol08G0232500 [Rhododendron molle]|uniref:Uncharacterized protein n=1 Tax=Rhododendron molle TaxID=49168 RepID=A0ACC0MSS1_RHOML|nr:hypothetical protein RHMOL_Rhmol08G0232500 [Rhododendron molle]